MHRREIASAHVKKCLTEKRYRYRKKATEGQCLDMVTDKRDITPQRKTKTDIKLVSYLNVPKVFATKISSVFAFFD